MSDMDDVSRRDLLRVIVLAGMASSAGAQTAPKHLTAHHFQTLRKLGDLIMPADDRSPAASEAGATEFIDFLCSRNTELAQIFDGGLAWLDDFMRQKYGVDFLTSRPDQQTAVLDAAYLRPSPEVASGQTFFTWARMMVVDAYYASPVGVKDVGYMGNTAMKSFSVPKEAVDYVMKRSPFASELQG
jgi:gluconate 2-dehydrogenase gamma chain